MRLSSLRWSVFYLSRQLQSLSLFTDFMCILYRAFWSAVPNMKQQHRPGANAQKQERMEEVFSLHKIWSCTAKNLVNSLYLLQTILCLHMYP